MHALVGAGPKFQLSGFEFLAGRECPRVLNSSLIAPMFASVAMDCCTLLSAPTSGSKSIHPSRTSKRVGEPCVGQRVSEGAASCVDLLHILLCA